MSCSSNARWASAACGHVLTFNIDQSVRSDAITGSTVGITRIQGDIVNGVQAA